MDASYKSKILASAVTALLVFSSILFLAGAEADAADDLSIIEVSETMGSPPPRQNIPYDFVVGWENTGDTVYEGATVRLYDGSVTGSGDCNQGDLTEESEQFDIGEETTGTLDMQMTFTSNPGETCFYAIIHVDGEDVGDDDDDYNQFIAYVNVEPESGDADLWIELDMEGANFAAGEPVDVVFAYGNDGEVSTLNPVTLMAYFDPIDSDPTNSFEPSPFVFDYISPPPADAPPEAERMEWDYTIPEDTEDGVYKFTVVIDSENENNDEDPDLTNNMNELEVCIGDCSEPDLKIWEGASFDSIRVLPQDPIAGMTLSFFYSIENIGEGRAQPPGPFDDEDGTFVSYIEIRKCPDSNCDGQDWVRVNQTQPIRTAIEAGDVLSDDAGLKLNWSTSGEDAGIWNVRIIADGENVIDESDDCDGECGDDNTGNNALDWFKVHNGYFELKEQRPDLMVTGIDEGNGKVYEDDPRTISVAVSQTGMGDAMAEDVEVYLKYRDPDLNPHDWFCIEDENDLDEDEITEECLTRTIGLAPETTFFDFTWTPNMLGVYEFYAYVDREDKILEWDDTNNEYTSDKYIEVFEKLPDLQVVSMSQEPVNEDGYAMVGVSSQITATIANLGVRDMTGSEGTKLEVSFYTSAPFASNLGTINVKELLNPEGDEDGWQGLAIGESVDVTIPFTFTGNDQYRLIAKVDENKLISEADENNNEAYKNIYAVSSIDAYVTNMSVHVGDGLAGKDHPITFDLGMANLPDEGTYRLFFNVSIDGTFGWGDVLSLSTQNMSGSYPVGTGYSVSQDYGYGYIDFNSSYNRQTVVLPWIPEASRPDDYNVSVKVSSVINVDETNDEAFFKISIEKLTTNLVVDAIKVSESDGSATIKVTVGYPQGEQSQLDADVLLQIYKASDYDTGNPPIDELTPKTITGILKGDSRPISFTWAVKNGNYIFVAVLDPDDKVKEINEDDNTYPSLMTTFGDTGPVDTDEEEDDSLLPAPSIVTALAMIGVVALSRRRS